MEGKAKLSYKTGQKWGEGFVYIGICQV